MLHTQGRTSVGTQGLTPTRTKRHRGIGYKTWTWTWTGPGTYNRGVGTW
jgi:hypothetical protein